jgi:hypothetical protein
MEKNLTFFQYDLLIFNATSRSHLKSFQTSIKIISPKIILNSTSGTVPTLEDIGIRKYTGNIFKLEL